MPNFVKMQQTLAGLAMISTVMSMIAPSAQADRVEVRGLIKAHYERNLTKLQLDKEKEATLRRLLRHCTPCHGHWTCRLPDSFDASRSNAVCATPLRVRAW